MRERERWRERGEREIDRERKRERGGGVMNNSAPTVILLLVKRLGKGGGRWVCGESINKNLKSSLKICYNISHDLFTLMCFMMLWADLRVVGMKIGTGIGTGMKTGVGVGAAYKAIGVGRYTGTGTGTKAGFSLALSATDQPNSKK